MLIAFSITYGAPYAVSYVRDSITSKIWSTAKKKVVRRVGNIFSDPEDIEYEYIRVDSKNEPIFEPMLIVTSQSSIEKSWACVTDVGVEQSIIIRTPSPDDIIYKTKNE